MKEENYKSVNNLMILPFNIPSHSQSALQALQTGENSWENYSVFNLKAGLEKEYFIQCHLNEYRRYLEQTFNHPFQNFIKSRSPQIQNIGASLINQNLSPVLLSQPLKNLSNSSEEEIRDDIFQKFNEKIKAFQRNQGSDLSDSENSESARKSEWNELKPQRGQNKMKNHQGAIAGKIKKLCKKDKKTGCNTRLFERATANLTDEQKEEFREWMATYQKKDKTWTSLRTFLSSKREFGEVFVDMIDLLLSEEFEAEYKQCLEEGKMSDSAKAMLSQQENKNFYRLKFALIMDEIQGKALNYENEIRKSRKTLKTK